MRVRKKVVPPVRPQIVRPSARSWMLRYGLVAAGFALSAWLGHQYGREPAPAGAVGVSVHGDGPAQRIEALEQERRELKRQVAELERSLAHANRALASAQAAPAARPAPSRKPVEKASAAVKASSPKSVPALADAASPADSAATALLLEGLGVESLGGGGYRLAFAVRHGGGSDRVVGTIWIAVDGLQDGKPRRLSLRTLSADQRPYVKMGFSERQTVVEELRLPPGFQPRNLLIEVKPYGDDYTGTTRKIPWPL